MRALRKGTPVRVVRPDLMGEVLATETNSDEFGYRVAFVDGGGQAQERFFAEHEVEMVTPLKGTPPLSVSLSGTKAEAVAQVNAATKNVLAREGLAYFIMALPGTHVSGSLSISEGSFSFSGTTWEETQEEDHAE